MPRFVHSLQAKVMAIFLVLIVVSLGALSLLAYGSSSSIFMDQTTESMRSILTFRSSNLTSQLLLIRDQATSIAKIESLQQSMVNLKSGWKSLDKAPGDARKELQKYFVTGNPNPPEQREALIKPEGPGGYYYSAHEELQPAAAKLLATGPFKDILMADGKGNIFYSYKKGDAFGENVNDPKWADTGLKRVLAAVTDSVKNAKDDEILGSFSGLAINKSTGASDIYFAVPVANLGVLRGTILFQVKDQAISTVLSMAIPQQSAQQADIITSDGMVIGTDATGRLVAVDPAPYQFREAAFASPDMSTAVFERTDGTASSFSLPVKAGNDTYLISESIPQSELKAGAIRIAWLLAMLGMVVLVLAAVAAGLMLRRMFGPLGKLAVATGAVAAGNLESSIDGQSRRDEIGTMSKALAGFRDSLIAQQDLERQAKEARNAEEEARQQRREDQRREAETLARVVSALGAGLDHMANGDLAVEISEPFPPALETLRIDFNSSVVRLAEALTAIGSNSKAVRAGTEEMREGADQLATRTERQSASISQAAAAIDAITSSVSAQMARAEEASRIAHEATAGTNASAEIMNQTISAMEAIQGSSQQINSIISVIDEIAFQTNLLALNAGVEAARAGESGKGFAVVAQEVRELAQRSARAAKEISALLGKSTSEVEAGVSMVEKAGTALRGIGQFVESINRQIVAMMEATREEAATLKDINASVGQLETMTQQNASMVEETTASIHQLAQEASEMDRRIGQFRLKNLAAQDEDADLPYQRSA